MPQWAELSGNGWFYSAGHSGRMPGVLNMALAGGVELGETAD